MNWNLSHRLTMLLPVPLLALALCLSLPIRSAAAKLTPGTSVSLQAQANGKYVCADNAGTSPLIANRTAVGSYETFTVVNAGGGNVALQAQANGEYVCADNAGASPLIANRTAVGPWETFAVHTLGSGPVSNVPKVYIGTVHGWSDLNNNPNQWSFVRANADGFYANFIQLLPTVGNPALLCNQTASLMTHKNAYFESDSRYTGLGGFPNGGQFTLDTEAQEMNELLNAGFAIAYSSLNYGVDGAKENQCRTLGLPSGVTRPCLAQNGPWTFNGDVHNDPNSINDINNSDGVATDGPLQLWISNSGGMQQGSVSDVRYARSVNKLAVVMVSPGDLPASQWLATAQQCVRFHESQGAKPDIWADYAYDTQTPTLPEANADGTPANTVTGMAYWLIHHVTDPAHWARLSLPATSGLHLASAPTTLPASVRAVKANTGTTPTESTEADLLVPVTRQANGHVSATRVVDLVLHNESAWLDLSPVLYADIADPGHHWTVGFRLGGKDITQAVVREGGFVFVKDQRLWPNVSKHLQLVLICKNPSGAGTDAQAVSVRIGLLANPTRRDKLTETLTIHGSAADKPEDKAALSACASPTRP